MSRHYAYLIELAKPLGNDTHSARYYLGITDNLEARLKLHRSGQGSKFLAAATAKGIDFEIVRSWVFSDKATAKLFEQKAKRSLKNHSRLLGGRYG
jgi:putative endonuclease